MEVIPAVTVPEGAHGPWTVKRKTIEDGVALWRLNMEGRSPGKVGDEITMLVHERRGIVMSDTKAERRDHVGFVVNAYDHVLINGLGIGMCLNAVLRRKEVTAVTVVEMDPDVIALVGPHYASDLRVNIVNASAYDYKPPRNLFYGAVWHDIWDTISTDNLPGMHKLHRKYGRRTVWQGSWARFECERAKDQERHWRRSYA